jgi:shikimate dehydrogenase
MKNDPEPKSPVSQGAPEPPPKRQPDPASKPVETGGPRGLEPTRYGDWERGGRCIDF